MFTERVPFVRSPMPIVFANDDTRFVREVIHVMNMPADVALAYNSGGCAEGGHHHDTCDDYGSGKEFLEHLHFISMSAPRYSLSNARDIRMTAVGHSCLSDTM